MRRLLVVASCAALTLGVPSVASAQVLPPTAERAGTAFAGPSSIAVVHLITGLVAAG